MKKILITILTIFLTITFSKAQDDQMEKFQYDTEEVQSESASYFSVGAGYTATFHLINLDEINKVAKQFNLSDLKSTVYLNGIEISTGVIVVKNLNIGFFNQYGNSISSNDSSNVKTSLNYSFQNTGFIVDYAITPFKSFAILPGLQIGFASSTIDIAKTNNDINWNDIKPYPSNDFYYKLEKSYLNIEPRVSIEYAVTNFLMFRANASYNISTSNPFTNSDWKYNDNAIVKNVPDNINQSGLKFQLGIFVGLMNY
jgi:hypothetical protein